MRAMRRADLSVALLLGLVLVSACTPLRAKYEIKLPERHGKLPNGLRVIILPDDSTQLAAVAVRYEVGAAEDPPGKAGLAHLAEHMMFQQRPAGPEKPPFFTLLRQVTIYFNAYTTWDTTHYDTLGTKEQVGDLIAIEATRLFTGCETISEEQFQRELEVVRNEIRQRSGSPEGRIDYRLLEDLYPEGHAYREMVGGDDAQLVTITLADVCAFMKQYYVPSRATLIVAGNVTEADVTAHVNRWFAGIPAREPAPRRAISVSPLAPTRITHELDVEEPSVHVSWRMPPRYSADDTAAQYAMFAVYGGVAAAGDEWDFATDVSPRILGGSLDPTFVISVTLRDEKDVDEALEAVWRIAANVHRGWEASSTALDDQRARQIADFVYSFEDLNARTNQFGDYVQFAPTGGYFGGELARIDGFDPVQVKAYAKSALARERASVVVVKAKKGAERADVRAKPSFSGRTTDLRDALEIDPSEAKRRLAAPKGESLAGLVRFTLGNGMRVMMLPSTSALPVMTVKVVFGVGSAHESAAQQGLASIAGDFLRAGGLTSSTGGEQASTDALGSVGAQRSVEVGQDHTVFTARGLSIYQEVLIKGLERQLKVGLYSQEGIENYRKYFAFAAKRAEWQASQRFRDELGRALYGEGHPYARSGDPTAQTISALGQDAAAAWRDAHFSAKNATILVAGRFNAADVEATIRENFGDWSAGRTDAPVTAFAAKRTSPVVIGVEGPELPHLRVVLAYPAPPGVDGQYAARLVLGELLTLRMGAVREELGTSYGVYARLENHLGPGAYVMGGSLDAPRAGESLAAMRAGVESLRKGERFDADFVRARRSVLRRLVGTSTSSMDVAEQIEFLARYDVPAGFRDKLMRQVASLSPAQVQDLIAAELVLAREVVVLQGDPKALAAAFTAAGLTPTSSSR